MHAHDPPPPCGHAVCVELQLDPIAAPDQVTLSLRRAQFHHDGPANVELERAMTRYSLSTGQCIPIDALAEHLFAEHRWLADTLRSQLELLRDKARRLRAQRDRTTCFAALRRAEPGAMLAYDLLFPADWDLLVHHDGELYWALDHHCPNAACTCQEITVELHHISAPQARLVGNLRIDFAQKSIRPRASCAAADQLFAPLWRKHGAVLLMRYGEVRRAVRAHALSTAADSTSRETAPPARNAPCPCGSGKKYKRCCADRAPTARGPATPGRAVR